MAGKMIIPWPSTIEQWCYWAQVTTAWILAVNLFDNIEKWRDPVVPSHRDQLFRESAVRGVCAALLSLALGGASSTNLFIRLVMALFLGGSVMGLWLLRLWASPRRLNAESEIAGTAGVLCLSAMIVGGFGLTVDQALLVVPASTARVTAAFALVSAVVLVITSGTRIVRGILDKADALPPLRTNTRTDVSNAVDRSGAAIDLPEYNRGKTIGNLERLLMLIVVLVGSYEALGFLIAAKGLIRSKEFENRDFCEYFIVGNLASALVALTIAIPLRQVLRQLI